MRKGLSIYDWQQAVIVLTGTVLGATVVAALYWAQAIFVPLALAVFLSFLLSPLVATLERKGVRRTPAVLSVVLATTLTLGVTGWVVTRQLVELVQELPQYSDNIKAKIKSLRELTQGSGTHRLARMAGEITEELRWNPTNSNASPKARTSVESVPPIQPQTIIVQAETSTWIDRLVATIRALTESLANVALAVVLVNFILVKRESLRNRLIRLIGQGRMAATTRAVDDGVQRISRFLLMQLIINGAFGVIMAIGLFLLGIDYALLWGFLAAALRYVPYIGAWIAAIPPTVLSMAMYQGWAQPLMVVGFVLVLELITSNLIEPWLYGQSMGVSEVAMLVAAAFWAFLWGPIGLILSSPLTVGLVVLGKYVPQLEFFDVLLGDDPALEPRVSFYQRLLARDQDEAAHIVQTHLQASSMDAVYDEILLPALSFAKRDREKDELTDQDEQFILTAIADVAADLDKRSEEMRVGMDENSDDGTHQVPLPAPVSILACPAQDGADRLALEMLRQLLDPVKWDVRIVAQETLAAELVEMAKEQNPGVICIASLPPGGLAHSRYLCKRLRLHLPDVKILAGRWGLDRNIEQNLEQLREAGADDVETTLLETRAHLTAWLPILSQRGGGLQLTSKQ